MSTAATVLLLPPPPRNYTAAANVETEVATAIEAVKRSWLLAIARHCTLCEVRNRMGETQARCLYHGLVWS